ncbi:MAG: chemotaxis-specific protein-glutamate methyltransferase CheB [Treponema sp.]|nr:chemotaxis-specific protein-glutamate methyltransferase CheB [Treponema sp.]
MNIIIVDDSAIIRAILEQNLSKENDFTIVDSVSTGRKAIDSAKKNEPDVILSDIDMPEMNGLESTKIISSKLKVPVIILSENEKDISKAKSAGAVDFILKPSLDSYKENFFNTLNEKIRKAYSVKNQKHSLNKKLHINQSKDLNSLQNQTGNEFKILCIGASTGGPTAVADVLSHLGNNFPLPIIYSQHIEVGADGKMAEWFNQTCKNLEVRLAHNGEEAIPGRVYMAPADTHLVIDFVKSNGHPVLKISHDPPWRFLRPSVNIMFNSASFFYKKNCLGVLLTGMGRDGAEGCVNIINAGGQTIVEDESTCAVFGMPKAAIEEGGASEILPRNEIPARILKLIGKN